MGKVIRSGGLGAEGTGVRGILVGIDQHGLATGLVPLS